MGWQACWVKHHKTHSPCRRVVTNSGLHYRNVGWNMGSPQPPLFHFIFWSPATEESLLLIPPGLCMCFLLSPGDLSSLTLCALLQSAMASAELGAYLSGQVVAKPYSFYSSTEWSCQFNHISPSPSRIEGCFASLPEARLILAWVRSWSGPKTKTLWTWKIDVELTA